MSDSRPRKYDYMQCPLRTEPPEFRVLKLLPGQFNDVILIHLTAVTLESDVVLPFEALSYTWGSQIIPQRVYVLHDDEAHPGHTEQWSSYINITQNLDTALRHVRYPTISRFLWIDAICINQIDMAERSQQVRQMPRIYGAAARVIIWLGPADDESNHTFRMLRQWIQKEEYNFVQEKIVSRTTPPTKHACPFDADLNAASALMQRPYFERAWIRQEVMLSELKAIIQCGFERMHWLDFKSAICCMNSCAPYLKSWPRAVERGWITRIVIIRNLVAPTSVSFTDMLVSNRHMKCLDPKDRVYSLLGMLPSENSWIAEAIQPDYCTPYRDLRIRVVEVTATHEHRLDILRHCDIGRGPREVPTWVPDWADGYANMHNPERQYADGNAFVPYIKVNGALLTTQAVHCAVVANVHLWPLRTTREWLADQQAIAQSELENLQYIVGARGGQTPRSEHVLSMAHNVCESIAIDHLSGNYNDAIDMAFSRLATIADWSDAITAICHDHEARESQDQLHWRETIAIQAHGKFYRRALAFTDQGHLPSVPSHALPGDVLMVLIGLSNIAVLRPQEDGTYLFVGTAFAHRLNWGEALFGPLPAGWRYVRHYLDKLNWCHKFQHVDADEPTELDPRINWDELKVDEEDVRCAVREERDGGIGQCYRRPDEEYLVRHGVKLETITIA